MTTTKVPTYHHGLLQKTSLITLAAAGLLQPALGRATDAGNADVCSGSAVAMLRPTNELGRATFGNVAAISGDTAVVAAPNPDDDFRGAAFVFVRNPNRFDEWRQVKKLPSPSALPFRRWAGAIAISGDLAFVADPFEGPSFGRYVGAVYLYARNQGGPENWGQIKKLQPVGDVDVQFGTSLALDGDTLAVGVPGERSVHVFRRDRGGADNWGEVKKITPNDAAGLAGFARSLAINGDLLVVAASDPTVFRAFYVFSRNLGGPDNWGQVKKVYPSEPPAYSFGSAIAITGDTVVAGAFADERSPGEAYVFERHYGGRDNWGQVKRIMADDAAAGDDFGASVAIQGDTIIVGAPVTDDANDAPGAVYLFARNYGGANHWGQVRKLSVGPPGKFDDFGRSVAVSGNALIVGAATENQVGAAYAFGLDFESPVFTAIPGPILLDASTSEGAFVSDSELGTVMAADNCPGFTVTRNGVPAHNLFPIGITRIAYVAADGMGHVVGATQTVTVRGANEQLIDLSHRVAASTVPTGTMRSLQASLWDAEAALARNHAMVACNELAAFIHKMEAHAGKQIGQGQASQWITASARIRAVLGCR